MYDELSVFENIEFYALLFNRRGYTTRSQVIPMITSAIKLLRLSGVALTLVGNAENKTISGGQKKRVSVAMEMMKESSLFLLDEPTSGLDSATSMTLLNGLHELADLGTTIVATLHQPRKEILALIQHLILLGPGGNMVYCGQMLDVARHFSVLGYTCPMNDNVADYLLDVITDIIPNDQGKFSTSSGEAVKYLSEWWVANRYPELERVILEAEEKSFVSSPDPLTSNRFSKSYKSYWAYTKKFWQVFYVSMNRELLLFHRCFSIVRIECLSFFFFGCIISLLFGEMKISTTSMVHFPAVVTSLNLTLALLCIAPSLRLFGRHTLPRVREEESGLMYIPYAFGKLLGYIITIILAPACFMMGAYALTVPRQSLGSFLSTGWLLQITVLGIVNMDAIIVPEKSRNLVAIGTVVLFWAVGGVSPPLSGIKDNLRGFGVFLNAVSPMKWTQRMMIVEEVRPYPALFHPAIKKFLVSLQYSRDDWTHCVQMLFLHTFLTNLAALLWLLFSRDHFKMYRDFKAIFFSNSLRSKDTTVL